MRLLIHALTMIVLAISVADPAPSMAQQETSSATLEETVKFIGNALPSQDLRMGLYSRDDDADKHPVYTFKMLENGKVEMGVHGNSWAIIQTLSLSDVDPLSIKPIGLSSKVYDPDKKVWEEKSFPSIEFEITCKERKVNVVSHSWYYGPNDPTVLAMPAKLEREPKTSLNTKSEYEVSGGKEMRDRVLRAFKHAVELSGGKVCPF